MFAVVNDHEAGGIPKASYHVGDRLGGSESSGCRQDVGYQPGIGDSREVRNPHQARSAQPTMRHLESHACLSDSARTDEAHDSGPSKRRFNRRQFGGPTDETVRCNWQFNGGPDHSQRRYASTRAGAVN
ncbi:MAG: hypothetical protein NVSMB4_01730 [Acidimicrobiales bacterium]